MIEYIAGLVTGCLLGVAGTLLILMFGAALPQQSYQPPRRISRLGIAGSALSIVAITYGFRFVHLDKDAGVMLLILSILLIARLAGLAEGLAATGVAAVMLGFFYLPPLGSLRIEQPGDRLLLTLFLLTATMGSRFIAKTKQFFPQRF